MLAKEIDMMSPAVAEKIGVWVLVTAAAAAVDDDRVEACE
jgi:hypothetical protein